MLIGLRFEPGLGSENIPWESELDELGSNPELWNADFVFGYNEFGPRFGYTLSGVGYCVVGPCVGSRVGYNESPGTGKSAGRFECEGSLTRIIYWELLKGWISTLTSNIDEPPNINKSEK